MQIAFSVIIVVGFGYLGVFFRSYLKERVVFYEDLIRFLKELEINISFLQEDFYCYIKNFQCESKDLQKILSDFLKARQGVALSSKQKMFYVRIKDVEIVESFLENFGKIDAENQISQLNFFKLKAEEKLKKEKQIYEKYSGVSIKLSLLIGLLFVLVLV